MEIDVDHHKLIYHPERLAEWLKNGDCSPIYVEIGPTNRCNHRCIFCALDWLQKQPQDINTDVLQNALKDMAAFGVKSVMFGGEGEPLMHPDIDKLIICAHNVGLNVALTTNGRFLDDKRLQRIFPYLTWIRVSLDAGTSQTHQNIHNSPYHDFSIITKNISNAVIIKRNLNLNVEIGLQMLLVEENREEILPFIKLGRDLGVDNVQIKPYSQHPLSNNRQNSDYGDLLFNKDIIKTYQSDSFHIYIREKTEIRKKIGKNYHVCHGLSFFALIESDGNIIPCNQYYQMPEYQYGNLNEMSFQNIWESQTRKEVLNRIKGEGTMNCREVCRLDAINRYLHDLKYPHAHVNFI